MSNRSAKSPFNDNLPTPHQAQYLAYIYQYTLVNGCAPAEADMVKFFGVTAPTVHSMIVRLEELGFIQRTPGRARSICLIFDPLKLPPLERPSKH